MNELRDLYQELILDHSKKPRNFRVIERADQTVEGFNPLCGDRFTVYLDIRNDRVEDVSFQGSGCAISKSSASLMTQAVKGKTKREAIQIFDEFHKMISGKPGDVTDDVEVRHASPLLGKLAVFQGVCEFPMRVKCASLAWHTLKSAIDGNGKAVTTE